MAEQENFENILFEEPKIEEPPKEADKKAEEKAEPRSTIGECPQCGGTDIQCQFCHRGREEIRKAPKPRLSFWKKKKKR